MWVKSIALCRRKSNTTGHVRIKKGEIVEFHVVITSRDNAAVLSSLINIVIVPLLPLLSSFSCCIIECENSILFCLQGQNWETSGSWRMNNILGQGMLFYIFPFFFFFFGHITEQMLPKIQRVYRWSMKTSSTVSPILRTVVIYCHPLTARIQRQIYTFHPLGRRWRSGDNIVCVWVQMWPHMTKIN